MIIGCRSSESNFTPAPMNEPKNVAPIASKATVRNLFFITIEQQ